MVIVTYKEQIEGIDVGNEVRKIFSLLNRQEKIWFGGPPFSQQINEEMVNYFRTDNLKHIPNRAWVALGFCALNEQREVIAYFGITIMNNARPTRYENDFMRLFPFFNYTQWRKVIVYPDYWGSGVAREFAEKIKAWARDLDKVVVSDYNRENRRVEIFLCRLGMVELSNWKTPAGSLMKRVQIPSWS